MKTKVAGVFREGSQYYIDTKITIKGRRVHVSRKGFRTVADAKAALNELKATKAVSSKMRRTDLDKLIKRYLIYRRSRVRSTTAENSEYSLHFLRPYLGRTADGQIRFQDISKWYNDLVRSERWGNERKNVILREARLFFEQCYKWKIVNPEMWRDIDNLLERVKEKSDPGREKDVMTPDELARFLEAIPEDSRSRVMFEAISELGCRCAEFRALKWSDFNPEAGTIEITKQIVRVKGGWHCSHELKTKDSYRVCHITPLLTSILEDYRRSEEGRPDDFIFHPVDDPKTPISKTTFARELRRWLDEAGIEKNITPHAFRHARATAYMRACTNLEEVRLCARELGHSTKIMMDVYSHVQEASIEEIRGRIAAPETKNPSK